MIYKNIDSEFARRVEIKILKNGGHCPCQLEKTEDTICKCKDFRDMVENGETGWCHCGLYYNE